MKWHRNKFYTTEWRRWYVWHPVRVDEVWVWFEWVERRILGRFPVFWHDYRFPLNRTSTFETFPMPQEKDNTTGQNHTCYGRYPTNPFPQVGFNTWPPPIGFIWPPELIPLLQKISEQLEKLLASQQKEGKNDA